MSNLSALKAVLPLVEAVALRRRQELADARNGPALDSIINRASVGNQLVSVFQDLIAAESEHAPVEAHVAALEADPAEARLTALHGSLMALEQIEAPLTAICEVAVVDSFEFNTAWREVQEIRAARKVIKRRIQSVQDEQLHAATALETIDRR